MISPVGGRWPHDRRYYSTLIVSGYSLHILFVSKGMFNIVVFLVSIVGMNRVMRIHILECIVIPCPLNSPTLVLYQYTISLPIMWLLFTYPPVLISGLGRAISLMFYPKTIDY